MAILSQAEIIQAQKLINAKTAGVYEVKEIYGTSWPPRAPTTFGKDFYDTVVTKEGKPPLNNIRYYSESSDHHALYEIVKAANAELSSNVPATAVQAAVDKAKTDNDIENETT